MAMNETYHSLLIDYASGALDEAHALLVAAHMALSPNARRIVREYESIAGGMLQECCAPVAMADKAWQSVLDRLDDCVTEECKKAKAACGCPDAEILPDCLHAYIDTQAKSLPWHRAKAGLQTITVETRCRQSVAELVRIKGGATLPKEQTYEVTLVLEGAFRDGEQIYSRGDIIILNDEEPCAPRADKKEGCIALVVMPGNCDNPPDHHEDLAHKILNFLKS